MQNLTTFQDYCRMKGISERYLYLQIKAGKIIPFRAGRERYVIEASPEVLNNPEVNKLIREEKKREYNERIKQIGVRVKTQGRDAASAEMIKEILSEISELKKLGIIIKGFTQRSIQRKVYKVAEWNDELQRKTRADKFTARNRVMKENPEAFGKALDLTAQFFIQDPLGSLSLAIDRARDYARQNEEYYEVMAINIYTLKRHVKNAFRHSGMRTLNEFMNHYNQFKKRQAFVKGAFTNDLDFFDVFSLDDHKMDVAGALTFNGITGKFEAKKIYSWVVVEIKTMMPLAWQIQTEPFKDDDIIRLLMRVFKQWGLPKKKVICDQGLSASAGVKEFMNRLGCVLDAQPPYTPTAKAPNERFFKLMKNEIDVYMENFVGSNHPVEGRHRGQELSPEATTELASEAVRRYETYFKGFCIERPRKREIDGIEHLLDNTKRCSIKDLFDYYYLTLERTEVTDERLRAAYMKRDIVTNFESFYLRFKKEIYLPTSDVSIVFNDPKYKYTVAWNPNDLNTIDLYTAQDIIDMLTGEMIPAGEKVCQMESLRNLTADEKKARVAAFNKKQKKTMLELARGFRERYAKNDIINEVIAGDGTLKSVQKEQEAEITRIIKEALPLERIEAAVMNIDEKPDVDINEALSDESFASLDNIKVD